MTGQVAQQDWKAERIDAAGGMLLRAWRPDDLDGLLVHGKLHDLRAFARTRTRLDDVD